MFYATNRLIDSVWTLEYTVIDNKIHIHSYDRTNPVGYAKERDLAICGLITEGARIVTSVRLSFDTEIGMVSAVRQVDNPKYIFNYPEHNVV